MCGVWLLWLGSFHLSAVSLAQEEYIIELRNGMRLGPGRASETDTLTTNSFQRGGGGESQTKPIGVLDDGLRLTYYNNSRRNLQAVRQSTQPKFEQIVLPSAGEVNSVGDAPTIYGVAGISQFNRYGRRTHSFITSRGQVDVVQGITLLTPEFAKVEILRSQSDKFAWDQRIALSSIPADQLREILHQALDLSKPTEWLRLYKFYVQAERFTDARDTIAEALRRFPEDLTDGDRFLKQAEQLLANQKFEEIRLRQSAGQHRLAFQLMLSFPEQTLPLETQVQLSDQIQAIQQQVRLIAEVTEALQRTAERLPEPEQQVVAGLVEEIRNQINIDSAVRLADFQRLRADESMPPENLMALAMGGWMLGSGSGIQNFAVANSLLRVRNLVEEYLGGAGADRRRQILEELRGEEGAEPQLIAKLIQSMRPPLEPPEVRDDDPPGLHRLPSPTSRQVPGEYLVQVPPEYDSHRKYPCILALPGQGNPPETEINYWCGVPVEMEGNSFRLGVASRYGYIVIAPNWIGGDQPEYQYTEGEQARILKTYRDALRRFSIDTDRVFLTGHFEGATAAWDIAQAHPSLWAGAVMISPGAEKYIAHYYDNVKASSRAPEEIPLATYVVFGGSDGRRFDSQLGAVATRYLSRPEFDSMVVEYRGRGRERFQAEAPRIMEWMELSSHRRLRTPREIEASTMRPGDRFFYWLEAPRILPTVAGHPFQFDASRRGKFEASLLDSAINGVRITSIPSANRDAWIWLTPEMVDFSRQILVVLRGGRNRYEVGPDLAVMLEDVRTRADRSHFFWQKLEAPR